MNKENFIIREKISFNLDRNKIRAIYSANMCLSLSFFHDKIEVELLKALLLQIHTKVQNKMLENKRKIKLTLTIAEAIAFYKLHINNNYDPYTFAIISQINSEIHSKIL